MSYDDDKFGPLFPTRFGGAIGTGNERKMLDNIGGSESFRTKVRLNPDGSTTTLRTRDGMPRFTTVKKEDKPTVPLTYYLHGVEIPMERPAYYDGSAFKPLADVVKYPTFHGATYGARTEHTRDQQYERFGFTSKWVGDSAEVVHSGWDSRMAFPYANTIGPMEFNMPTTGLTCALGYVAPGSVGVSLSWAGHTSNSYVWNFLVDSIIYGDGAPDYPASQTRISGEAGTRATYLAFVRDGELFHIPMALSRVGRATYESYLGVATGLPTVQETTFSTIESVGGATATVDITLPALPATMFRRTNSSSPDTLPIFQSYGAYPCWIYANPAGTEAVVMSRGGFYTATTYGSREFCDVGFLATIDLVTGGMAHLPVDTVFHRRYGFFSGEATNLLSTNGALIPVGESRDEYSILRVWYDASGAKHMLAQGARFTELAGYRRANVFALFVDGVSFVRLNADVLAAGTASINLHFFDPDDSILVLSVGKTGALSDEFEFVVLYNGDVVFTYGASIRSTPFGVTIQASNAATGSYALASDAAIPFTGTVAPSEPYVRVFEDYTGEVYGQVAGFSVGQQHPRALVSAALSVDRKRLAISIAPHITVVSSNAPIPCINRVIKLSNKSVKEFGNPNSYYNRLTFVDELL